MGCIWKCGCAGSGERTPLSVRCPSNLHTAQCTAAWSWSAQCSWLPNPFFWELNHAVNHTHMLAGVYFHTNDYSCAFSRGGWFGAINCTACYLCCPPSLSLFFLLDRKWLFSTAEPWQLPRLCNHLLFPFLWEKYLKEGWMERSWVFVLEVHKLLCPRFPSKPCTSQMKLKQWPLNSTLSWTMWELPASWPGGA